MENLVSDLIKQLNIPQLVVIALIGFYYYNRLDKKLDTFKDDTNKRFDTLKDDYDKKFESIDKRFERLENKQEETFKILLARIDAVNARLDALYRELFKRDAA